VLDDEFNGFTPVETGARDHRVADVILKRVTFVEHGGNSALRPSGGAAVERAFGQDQNFALFGQDQRSGQPGCTRSDDQYVVFRQSAVIPKSVASQKRGEKAYGAAFGTPHRLFAQSDPTTKENSGS